MMIVKAGNHYLHRLQLIVFRNRYRQTNSIQKLILNKTINKMMNLLLNYRKNVMLKVLLIHLSI